jgi:hypothetical protein
MIDRMRMTSPRGALLLSLTAALGATVATPSARGEDVRNLLRPVAANARAPKALRADGQITREGAEPMSVVLLQQGDRVYLETSTGIRALVRPGRAAIRDAKGLTRATPETPLPGTDFLLFDLAPFTAGEIANPQVSDAGPAGAVITGAPGRPSAYVLLVETLDPEHAIVVRAKYYQETVTNMVKMRRDFDPVQVGDRWRSSRITMEAFRPPNTTTLTLAWREAPETPPAVFTLAGLRAKSLVTPTR